MKTKLFLLVLALNSIAIQKANSQITSALSSPDGGYIQVNISNGKVLYCKKMDYSNQNQSIIAVFSGIDNSVRINSTELPSLTSYPGKIVDVSTNGDGVYNVSCRGSAGVCFTTASIKPKNIQNQILLNDGQGTVIYANKISIIDNGTTYGAYCEGEPKFDRISDPKTVESIFNGNKGVPFLTVSGLFISTYDFGNGAYKVSCGARTSDCFTFIRRYSGGTSAP